MHNKIIVLVFIATALCLCGCKKPEATPARNQPADKPQRTEVPKASEEQASALQHFQAGGSEADRAWQEVIKAMQDPPVPASWQTNPPTKEELAKFEKQTSELAASVATKAQSFYTRFPNHENAEEARDQEYQLLSLAAQLGHSDSVKRINEIEEARLGSPTLTTEERWEIRLQQLQRKIMTGRGADSRVSVETLEGGVRELQKEFPNRPETEALLLSAAQGWLEGGKVEKSRKLIEELSDSEHSEIKEASGQLLAKLNRLGKPLELKFTDLEGKPVDVQAMKGKVVLVDFWATWCRPCLAELPNVKTAYEKLHDKGFEIVGVSLDTDKAALEQLIKREKIPWPQFFGENEEASKVAEQFGITGIPAMWLVDKKGLLRDINARHDLASKVEKFLAEASDF